jgi:endonuclease-3
MVSYLNPEQVSEFFEILAQKNPHPKSELYYTNHYTLLVAVILSAQATDAGVNKATHRLFELAPTPKKMLALGESGLVPLIKTIGLYKSKATYILKMSELLIKNHDGNVPNTKEDLEKLPGVGTKTANVVLNVAFHQPNIAVDTHIFRVSNRTGLAPGKTPNDVEKILMKVVPDRFKLNAHLWLILLGRYICKARKPECYHCPVKEICAFTPKTEEP